MDDDNERGFGAPSERDPREVHGEKIPARRVPDCGKRTRHVGVAIDVPPKKTSGVWEGETRTPGVPAGGDNQRS